MKQKRFFSAVLAITMAFAVFLASGITVFASNYGPGICGECATYYEDPWDSDKIIITGAGEIYEHAFYRDYSFDEAEICYGITGIGDEAFAYCGIQKISIPDSVTWIGDYAFWCSDLKEVTIPDSVYSIGESAFMYSDIESVTFSEGIERINCPDAFYGCTYLEEINLPDSLKSIGNYAFRGCGRIDGITIPAGVTYIGDSAFDGCYFDFDYVYFKGTRSQWNAIDIGSNNETLLNADIIFLGKLGTPTATVKLNTSGKPVISWSAVDGATKYEVYRSVNGGAFSRLTQTNKTSVTHTGATAGNTYSYKVRTVGAVGEYSEFTDVMTVTITEEKLSAPTASVKLNTSGKPVISWGAVSGASKYEVWRSVNGGAYARLILTSKTSVTHSGATAGNTYSYKVRAVSSTDKYSEYSTIVTAKLEARAPKAPTASVKLNTSGKPVISWGTVSGASKYEVWRSVNGGAYARLILTSKTSVTHSGATAGNTYSYKVRAVDANGKYSDYSAVVTSKLETQALKAPTASVKLNTSGKPVVSWGAVSGASKYEVWRSVNGGAYSRLILTSKTSVTHSGATAGNTYSYKVRAVNANGKYSDYSAVVTSKLETRAPKATVTVDLNAPGKPIISWGEVDGATKYEVWRATGTETGTYKKLITTTKLSVTNSVARGTYFYKVRAVKADGTYSDYSNVVTFTLGPLTGVPTVTVKLNTSGKPVISWSEVSGASKYEVYHSVKGSTYARLILTSKTSVTHTGAAAGYTHTYKVRAVDENNNYSDYSSAVAVIPE